MNRVRLLTLLGALVALVMVLAACGEGESDEASDAAEDDAPLALEEDSDEADAEEEAGEDAAAESEEEAGEDAGDADFDVEAAVTDYASTIPDGWMAVGDTAEFKEALAVDDAVVIDVREEDEFAEGHIPGAVNIPIRELPENLDKVPTDRPVWMYCRTGWRAGLAVSSLGLMGYDNVSTYVPSAKGWEEAGEELVTEDTEAESFGEPDLEPELVDAAGQFLSTLPAGFLTKSLDDVKAAMDAGAAVIDVRQAEEYEEGHVPDAVSVPLRSIGSSADAVPTDTDAIVMCQSGYRASLALPVFHVLGYTNTEGFPGSFAAWQEAGEAVVQAE